MRFVRLPKGGRGVEGLKEKRQGKTCATSFLILEKCGAAHFVAVTAVACSHHKSALQHEEVRLRRAN